jgi:transcriptional regulator with XRE-family HTH domain
MNQVAERVRAKRTELGLTQAQLIARLDEATGGEWNPTPQEVLRVEAGTRTCLDVEVSALASVLGVSACWLLSETPPP